MAKGASIKKALLGLIGAIGFFLTWTGWTGPELLSEIASLSALGFVSSDTFRTILVIGGLALIAFAAIPASRFWQRWRFARSPEEQWGHDVAKTVRKQDRRREETTPVSAHIGYNEGEEQAEEAAKRDPEPNEGKKPQSRVTATQQIRTEVDEDGVEHRHVTVSPATIQIGARFPAQEPSVQDEPFRWDNLYAGDNSRPQESDLFLFLEVITRGKKSKWRRGLVCEVTTPSGHSFRSSAKVPDSRNRVAFYFPKHFDDSLELEDGEYQIVWLDAVDGSSEPATNRNLPVRQVILTSHRNRQRPGDRLVVMEEEAKRLINDGVATPLFTEKGE